MTGDVRPELPNPWEGKEHKLKESTLTNMEDMKLDLMIEASTSRRGGTLGSSKGQTPITPHFKKGLEAITAYYGFGNASLKGFDAMVKHPNGMYGHFGLWGSNAEDKSSNYQELQNLVKTVDEEVASGYIKDGELWIFTDNSTAKSCFHKGGSTTKLLHSLVLRLHQAELKGKFMLHLVHVAGTLMIAQGMDVLSQGLLIKGVMSQ
ncbi:hypothetical protein ACHAXA_000737 [Cyclostephanos tholiformis]|uniref:Uncharacterized protein n=1 Tax=Cyclostephanos tholiformis TaxID=382380 RepID=A0ABD3RWP6_9STRA